MGLRQPKPVLRLFESKIIPSQSMVMGMGEGKGNGDGDGGG